MSDAAAGRERPCDDGEVGAPELLGQRWKDVVPDCGEARPQLGHPRRSGDEPEMEMGAAVAPAPDVHAPDVAHGVDRSLDADDERPELGREL